MEGALLLRDAPAEFLDLLKLDIRAQGNRTLIAAE